MIMCNQTSPGINTGNIELDTGVCSPPSKITHLVSGSVRFGMCFGSVGLVLQPYMERTLVLLSWGHQPRKLN